MPINDVYVSTCSVGVQGTEWDSKPKFEGVMVSVGQGRAGREVPSKEHGPRKPEVRGTPGFSEKHIVMFKQIYHDTQYRRTTQKDVV